MSVTYGFYNSVNHDRVYDAVQMSSIFDGVIGDGVYETIGDALTVKPVSDLTVSIGTGRAWFNHTWTLNDALYSITLGNASASKKRYDAVVIEVDEDKRVNSFKIVLGEEDDTPLYPTLTKSATIHQYPLAYILRSPGQTSITAAHIINKVGTKDCPFVIGVVKTMTIDHFVEQWSSQWNDYLIDQKTKTDAWFANAKSEYETWFNNLKVTLDDNVAATLTQRVADLTDLVDTLMKGGSVTQALTDSTGDPVLDSSGNDISASVVYRPY